MVESAMSRWSTITPRPEQVAAVEAWLRAGGRGVIVMPTGTGKTVVAIHAMRALGMPKTLIVVPTVKLLKEWRSRLAYALNTFTGSYYNGLKMLSDITVAVYNSCAANPFIFSFFDFVVFDEVHHLGGEKFAVCLDKVERHRYVMGLTATLQRLDARHTLILSKLPLVYKLELADAKRLGRLAPLEVYAVGVNMSAAEAAEYHRLTAAISRILSVNKHDERAYSLISRRKALLASVSGKRHALVELVKSLAGQKILVFSESIESVEVLKEALEEAGIPSATYHSQKRSLLRDYVVNAWGRDFNVLLAVRALDEGMDVPDVSVGIIIASGKTTRQLVQRMGRLLRPKPDGGKAQLYVIYCRGTFEWDVVRRINGLYEGRLRYF